MKSLLRLRNVEARYGAFVALSNVSLIVPEGSVVALLGPNGVGKSTLLRTVSGMMAPTRGEIWFNGERIDASPDHRIAKLGLAHIPEGRGIFAGLSVRENLQMASYADDRRRVNFAQVWDLFPVLAQRRDQVAGTLSGGEQQMLALARAVVTKPKLLMVDELSLGLAPLLVGQLFETLQQLREQGTTILLVEQYVRYALKLADLCVILHKGHVRFIGDPAELSSGSGLVEAYLGGTQAAAASDAPIGSDTPAAPPTRTAPVRRATTPRSTQARRRNTPGRARRAAPDR
jgi:branched-chain amino acid transport system ATP-binding protein